MKTYPIFILMLLQLSMVAQSDSWTPAKIEGRWVFLNSQGDIVLRIERQAEFIGYFSEGLAPIQVEYDGLWGYMDTLGQIAIEPQFFMAEGFSEGLARCTRPYDEEPVDFEGTILGVSSFFIDHQGNVAMQDNGLEEWIFGRWWFQGPFKDGLAQAGFANGVMNYGLINRQGQEVVRDQFHGPVYLSEGWIAMSDGGEWMYVDREGRPMNLAGEWDLLTPFGGGVAIGYQMGEPYLIKPDGSYRVLETEVDYAHGFSEGLCRFDKDGLTGWLDTEGRIAIAPKEYEFSFDFKDGHALVFDADYQGQLIDRAGKVIISGLPYTEVFGLRNGLLAVASNGLFSPTETYGYYTLDGRFIAVDAGTFGMDEY